MSANVDPTDTHNGPTPEKIGTGVGENQIRSWNPVRGEYMTYGQLAQHMKDNRDAYLRDLPTATDVANRYGTPRGYMWVQMADPYSQAGFFYGLRPVQGVMDPTDTGTPDTTRVPEGPQYPRSYAWDRPVGYYVPRRRRSRRNNTYSARRYFPYRR